MKKYLFNQVFDEEVIEEQKAQELEQLERERLAQENSPPSYSVSDLETAKKDAFLHGEQEGKAKALNSIHHETKVLLDSIERQIDSLFTEHKNWTVSIQRESVHLAAAIMRKLAPELMRQKELPQIEHTINQAFQFLTNQPKVSIRVPSNFTNHLQGKIDLMASRVGYDGQVILIDDVNMPLSDCQIYWEAGAVERSIQDTWNQIDNLVNQALATTDVPSDDNPDSIDARSVDHSSLPTKDRPDTLIRETASVLDNSQESDAFNKTDEKPNQSTLEPNQASLTQE